MAPGGWVDYHSQHGHGRGWACGRCQTAANWDTRSVCRACGAAKPAGVAAAGRGQPDGKGKGEPPSPPWPKEEAAASPTPAEAFRKKGGGGWQQARAPTKVEMLQAQVLLFEQDPDVFDDELLVLTRGKLEAARALRDGGKPTFTRLAEAQARLSRKKKALPCSEKALLGEENAEGGPTMPVASAAGGRDAIEAMYLVANADGLAAFRKTHEDKVAAEQAAAELLAKAEDVDVEMADGFKTVGPGRGRRARSVEAPGNERRASRSRSGGRDIQERADELQAFVEAFISSGDMDDEAKRKKYLEMAETEAKRKAQAVAAPAGQSV